LNSPQAFGPYELTERINIGGMAEVFRAYDRAHKRLVAIKRILPSIAEDEEFIQMFRDEAAIASQLDHPNIAKIYDVGKVDLSYYLALEFVSGKDLRVIFDRAGRSKEPIPLDFLAYVMQRTAEGLDYAHHRMDAKGKPLGVVHRDVSPQNVLVSFDGDVKIIDFGIAKAAGNSRARKWGRSKASSGTCRPSRCRAADRPTLDVFSPESACGSSSHSSAFCGRQRDRDHGEDPELRNPEPHRQSPECTAGSGEDRSQGSRQGRGRALRYGKGTL
jgi:serine/threonine protein kinase